MANTKITALTSDTSPTSDDLILTVNDPAGSPTNRKVTAGNIVTKAHGLSDGLVKVSSGLMSNAVADTDYATQPITTLGDIVYGAVGGVPTKLGGNIEAIPKFLTQTGTGTVSDAPTWASLPVSGQLVYMLTGTSSDVATYKSMQSTSAYSASTLVTTTTAVSSSGAILGKFVTDVGYPNLTSIPAGVITLHYETQKASGTKYYTTYVELYKISSGGTETLLVTSDLTNQITSNAIIQQTTTAEITATTILATDRIAIKIYATMETTTQNIDLLYDDNTQSRVELPSATVDASNFVPYVGSTRDINTGTNGLTANSFTIGSTVASRILSTSASKVITALDTATYPSLTELSYAKGVTSSIQTQIDSKGTGTWTDSSTSTGSNKTFVAPALGTPASGVMTNVTGTASGLTSGNSTQTDALKSATTTVNVSSATAPTSGQVLTATDGTHATWATPAGGGGTPKVVISKITGEWKLDGTSANGAYDYFTAGSSSWTFVGAGSGSAHRGTTGTVTTAVVRLSSDQYGYIRNNDGSRPFEEDPQWFFQIAHQNGASGTGGKTLLGTHASPNTVPFSSTAQHVAVLGSVTSGVSTWLASNSSGTTQTSTNITAYMNSANSSSVTDKLFIDMTSGTNIKFYANNTLVATHTTNLPSGLGNGDGRWLVATSQNNGMATNQTLDIFTASLSINAY